MVGNLRRLYDIANWWARLRGLRELIDLGLLAIERGYLDPPALASALVKLRAAPGTPTPEELWVKGGPLTIEQLRSLLGRSQTQAGLGPDEAADAAFPSREDKPTRPLGPPEVVAVSKIGPPPPSAMAGEAVAARYARVGHLGHGGMGQILECVDRRLGRNVALKMIRPDQSNAANERMLEREARLTGRLEHPSIMPVYDLGLDGARPFYVMRLVRQPTLDGVIGKLSAGDEALRAEYTLGRLLRHFIQICQAVEYAHTRGVVHCDLKPSNILLGSFGEVLVLDWGMAFDEQEAVRYRGGTPGYMAPEQLSGTAIPDARTDVFALGAILYEILCLSPAFDAPTFSRLIAAMAPAQTLAYVPPLPPGKREPPWAFSTELDDICMRAIDGEPALRFQSARELSAAVEEVLEGTKKREQRRQRAELLIAQGRELAESYREFVASRPDHIGEIDAIRAQTAPWASPDDKRPLWEAEERQLVTDGLAVRTLQAAVAAYEQALDDIPGHPAARRGLADLYVSELDRAQERRDEHSRIYFEELVKQYDDGDARERALREGMLSLRCTGGSADVTLAALAEHERRLVHTRERALGAAPIVRQALPPGSYLAVVTAPGASASTDARIAVPLLVRPSVERVVEVDLARVRSAGPGEIYVAAGPALLGDRDGGAEPCELDVDAFFIDAAPTPFSQYLVFLEEIARTDADAAMPHVPCSRDGARLWEWDGERFGPAPRLKEWSHDVAWLLELPTFGVDARSASAYAAWRSRRAGHAYRLPNEHEWEKAARGVDGRRFPWGDRFDAAFCKMRQSRPGLARPEPAGAFAADTSPYGVRDLAGGIADWVTPVGDPVVTSDGVRQLASRGGAWCDWQIDCHLSARRTYLEIERSPRVGFRLARSA